MQGSSHAGSAVRLPLTPALGNVHAVIAMSLLGSGEYDV